MLFRFTSIFSAFLISFTLLRVCSQTVLVVDKTTLEPLEQVLVYSQRPHIIATTNSDGYVELIAFEGLDSIFFKRVDYMLKIVSYNELKETNTQVLLTVKSYNIDEVIVSASKFEEKRRDAPQHIEVIDSKNINELNQQTAADLLQGSGKVFVQKSQMGGGSPVIRGFEANKVLIVVDGIRMNNAIYRGGHLQNIITIDNNSLDRVEVVYGPGSVIYGSDALGGIMHFYTRQPRLSTNNKAIVNTNVMTRYSSANSENSAHFDFNVGLQKIAWYNSFSYSNYGNLRQGNMRNPFYGDWGKRSFYVNYIEGKDSLINNEDPNIQMPSGYTQYDVLQKLLFKQNSYLSHTLNFQLSTSSNIPRYDRLNQLTEDTLPKYAEWYYGPQKRILTAYHLDFSYANLLFNNSRITLAYQNIKESRHSRKYQDILIKNREEKLDIFSLNADFEKKISKHEIRYGLEANLNKVYSNAYSQNIINDSTYSLDTRYPDAGSNMSSAAAYLSHTYELSEKVIFSEGIRYSYVNLNANFSDTSFYSFLPKSITQINNAVTGNVGIIAMPGHNLHLSLFLSSGFRSPNVDDMGKIFDSQPGSVIVPNEDLKSEYTYSSELSMSKVFADRLHIESILFFTYYKDAVSIKPFNIDGQDSIYYEGELSQVLANVNSDKAYIYGSESKIEADISENFSLVSSLVYTYGRILTDTTPYPLDHIPPIYGKTGLKLKLNMFSSHLFMMYNGWKKLEDYNIYGEDNFTYATEYGMPSWITLNLNTVIQIDKHFRVQLAVENILDKNYRVFASGIHAPGRNIVVTFRGKF